MKTSSFQLPEEKVAIRVARAERGQIRHITTMFARLKKLVEETGLAPAARCLQGSVASMEHAPPLVADRKSNPTLRFFKPALSLVSYSAILEIGSNARFCPGDLPLIKRMLYSLSYIGNWLARMD